MPVLLTLSLISLAAAISGAGYVLAVRHSIRHVIHAALVGGPLIFAVCGVVALAGSFSSTGFAQSASDAGGWRLGVRLFALVCFGVAWMLARVALRRRKQVARAVAIGEVSAGSATLLHSHGADFSTIICSSQQKLFSPTRP